MMTIRLFFFSAFILINSTTKAQCSGCTTTISSLNSSGIVVTAGQTVCITMTGILKGGAIVNAGGVLCNEGIIEGGIDIMSGGIFNNYGDSITGGISVWGTFNNFGNLSEEGSVTVLDTLLNYGELKILSPGGLSVDSGGYLKNFASGNIVIGGGFSLGDSSGNAGLAENYGCIRVTDGGFFVYDAKSSLYTETVIFIDDGGFENEGTVTGPATSCGGVKVITGGSENRGIYGVSGNLDICDAANPSTGFGNNSGTIGPSTTFCVCQNSCGTVDVVDTQKINGKIKCYPNPAHSIISISFSASPGKYLLEVYDVMGKKIYACSVHQNNAGQLITDIPVADLSIGLYLVKIAGEAFLINTRFVKD